MLGRRGRRAVVVAGVGAAVAVALVTTAIATGGGTARGVLTGYQEVPAVSTAGSGTFELQRSATAGAYDFTLSYTGLEGAVTQSHIHFGQARVNGGISVWLCSNLPSPPTPAGLQPCPQPPATVTGTFTAADVVGPAGQGIAPTELDELVAAVRAGRAYANVHSAKFPGGEIRAQVGRRHDDHDHGHHD